MLSRTAQGLYWMSRYLERAEHTCRLLATQFEALEDRTVEEIDQYWRRIYASTGASAIGTEQMESSRDEDFMLTDSFTLADILTFDTANNSSIISCVGTARENARHVRNAVGRQLWMRLNTAHLDMQANSMIRIWDSDPESFYLNTEDVFRTLSGILHSTMYRDHGWNFHRLGRYVERMQIVASLLNAQVQIFPAKAAYSDSDWSTLLLICDSQLAYHRTYSPLARKPREVYDFLITDASLPHSIRFTLNQVVEHLNIVSQGRTESKIAGIFEHTRRVEQYIAKDWQFVYPDESELRSALQGIMDSSLQLNDAISKAYFDYQLDSLVTQ